MKNMLQSVFLVVALATALAFAHNLDEDLDSSTDEDCKLVFDKFGVKSCTSKNESCTNLTVTIKDGNSVKIEACIRKENQVCVSLSKECPDESQSSKNEYVTKLLMEVGSENREKVHLTLHIENLENSRSACVNVNPSDKYPTCTVHQPSVSYYDDTIDFMEDVMFDEIEECDYGVVSDSEMYGVELKCQVLSEKCSQLKVILESGETGTIVGCLENNDKCATIDLSKTCPTERIDSKHELALRNIFFKLGKTEEQASISAEVSTSSDVFCGYSTSKACKEGTRTAEEIVEELELEMYDDLDAHDEGYFYDDDNDLDAYDEGYFYDDDHDTDDEYDAEAEDYFYDESDDTTENEYVF